MVNIEERIQTMRRQIEQLTVRQVKVAAERDAAERKAEQARETLLSEFGVRSVAEGRALLEEKERAIAQQLDQIEALLSD